MYRALPINDVYYIKVAHLNSTVITVQWIFVNDSKLLQFQKTTRYETTFSISVYGYDSSLYKFYEVDVNAQAAGDLNSDHEYILTYLNSNQVGDRWNTPGITGGNLRQLNSYPIRRLVDASSFTMAVVGTSSVGTSHIKFTLVTFRVAAK